MPWAVALTLLLKIIQLKIMDTKIYKEIMCLYIINTMDKKICKVCNEEKSIKLFTKGKGACMNCRNEKRKESYKEGKEDKKQKLREEFLKKYKHIPHDEDIGMEREYLDGEKHIFILEEHFYDLFKKYEEKYSKYEPEVLDQPPEIRENTIYRLQQKGDYKYVRDIKHIFFNRFLLESINNVYCLI